MHEEFLLDSRNRERLRWWVVVVVVVVQVGWVGGGEYMGGSIRQGWMINVKMIKS